MSEQRQNGLSQIDESKTQQQQTWNTVKFIYLKYLLWCAIPLSIIIVIFAIIMTIIGTR